MSTLHFRSPAKVNLALEIVGKRADGYHGLRSIVVGVDWGDDLTFKDSDAGHLQLHCDHPQVPLDDRNLIRRAAERLISMLNRNPGCEIHLEKRIPLGGGMGGGSSNAATTLTALNHLWECGLTQGHLMALGATLGSDVPLFFHLPAAQISGRGELVSPIELAWAGWFVLVTSGVEVATSSVYQAWRTEDRSSRTIPGLHELRALQSAEQLGECLFNDLEPAIGRVCPAMLELRALVESVALRPARITGAGGVVFVVCDGAEVADNIMGELSRRESRLICWKARPLTQPAWQR